MLCSADRNELSEAKVEQCHTHIRYDYDMEDDYNNRIAALEACITMNYTSCMTNAMNGVGMVENTMPTKMPNHLRHRGEWMWQEEVDCAQIVAECPKPE
jgi:hypothetical protein